MNDLYLFIVSPIITVQPVSQVVKDKERGILVFWIFATGMEPLYYQWQKYDQFSNGWIPPSSRAESIESLNLTFSVITEEDQGIYRCIVSNEDGCVVSNNVTVTVYGMLVIITDIDSTVYMLMNDHASIIYRCFKKVYLCTHIYT